MGMQAEMVRDIVGVLDSHSFRKCTKPDKTAEGNPVLVRMVKGRICVFPQTSQVFS